MNNPSGDTAQPVDRSLKVTVVGDSGTGKTCLLKAFANNKFPEEETNCQSLFENSKGTIRVAFTVGNERIEFGLTDTIGTENYRSLREVFAANTNIFLVCFSVTDPVTMENVKTNWLTEIKALTPGAPFILVGTKTDLRQSTEVLERLKSQGADPVSMLKGIKIAKRIGALEYVECSAVDMIGVKEVFTAVAMVTNPNSEKSGGKRKPENGPCVLS
ncbi:RACC-like protein [Mya arenaria]|uniref:RACC-like protein n=1 Tax=Mya arenaria TaxID=6604 RepID=A0ABY7FF49_MYAAR|nr:RACC-like protein [Mya arenaria]